MKVLLSEQGYVVSYALEGELLDAVEAAEPGEMISDTLRTAFSTPLPP